MHERVGFATGYDGTLSAADMAGWMALADTLGYEIGFFSETVELMRDSVTTLAAMAVKTSTLTLGCTQIVRLRSPLVMAQTLATLDELTGGRIILAPGACTASHAKRYGLPAADPARSLREWVDVMRRVLNGEDVTYEGETIKVKNASLGWKPPRSHIPMWIAATSRTGLRIAGQIGDGVLLNAVCSPEYSTNAIRIVREAVEEAGRSWDEFEVAQLINCSVEHDERAAIAAIKWEVASKFDPIQLPFIAGPKMRVGEPYIRQEDLPKFKEAWERGGRAALIEAVPDSYVTGMTASGTPPQVLARVQEYRRIGVRLPILRPAAKHQTERLLRLFAPN